MISAKVIEDSISNNGKRLTTMEWSYPRFIHGEVMTHRVFSRNAMSSRAVPVRKMIDQVRNNPVIPHVWGLNQAGMQSFVEADGAAQRDATDVWLRAADAAGHFASRLVDLNIHKQFVNRLLEPFQWMRTIITATEWDNFFELRDHPAAEPHFQLLAQAARKAMAESTPTERLAGWPYDVANWHLPYVSADERNDTGFLVLAKVSTARCARVSYLTHDGEHPVLSADLALYDRLAGGSPMHASPLEHQAFPCDDPSVASGNFFGWHQFRQLIEMEKEANA